MSDRRGQLWTTEEDQQLIKEMNEQLSLADIVANHGRTPSAILSRLQGLHIITYERFGWHRIDPDPWVLHEDIRRAQRNENP